jgi:deazaflavin-dependent oxidoreductase (nitroreductase family)
MSLFGEKTVMSESSRPPPKLLIKLSSKVNVFLYRLSGGRITGKLFGTPICLVTMTGRKSGRDITIPLMYNPDGENVILVASLGGAPKNPLWYYNLIAHPRVTIQMGSTRREMLAEQATPEQKAALWPVIVANFPNYELYQQRTQRDIPLMICSPIKTM